MDDWKPTPEQKALSEGDTYRSIWLALAYKHGKCPLIAVESHRAFCKEMGYDESSDGA